MSTLPSNRHTADRNAEATVHIAHLDEKVTDALLWELMVQAGPVHHVYIPRNRITGAHFGYGFCEFHAALDAYYATKVLNSVVLFSKPLRISQSTVDRVSQDVGANLFIGNLVEEVDEKTLHDAFSAFGPLIDAPQIMRSNTSNSSGEKKNAYGFVKYGQFEHSDEAIAAMNGQYICNHPISVQYAFKKDSDSRERHGSHAERVLAERARNAAQANSLSERLRPNMYFSDQPASKRVETPPPPQAAPLMNTTVPSGAPIPITSYNHQQKFNRHQSEPQAVQVPGHPPHPSYPTPHPLSVPRAYPLAVHPNSNYGAPMPHPAWSNPTQHMRQQSFQPHHRRHPPPPLHQQFQLPPHQRQQHSHHQHAQPPYSSHQQPHTPGSETADIGWSQSRRFGSHGPPHSGPPHEAPIQPYPARKTTATPVEDDQAPPPPQPS